MKLPMASALQRRDLYWVSVGDHLPDDDITVLVCGSLREHGLAYRSGGQWWDASLLYQLSGVSHWMDLPKPPISALRTPHSVLVP